MSKVEIITLIVSFICLLSFCVIFTMLFKHHYLSGIEETNNGKYDLEIIDLAIINEKKKKKKSYKVIKLITNIASYTLIGVLSISFIFTLIGKVTNSAIPIGNFGLIAIQTGSMSEKNESNDYLFANNLNNQIQTFDLIGVNKVNQKEDLALYDIIVFKDKNNNNIIHRIIEINEYGYVTQGDSNNSSDKGVLYDSYLSFDDVLGKYNGFKIPVVGIFVIFLQSSSGILTILALIYCLFMFDHYKSKYQLALNKREETLLELLGFDINQKDNHLVSVDVHTIRYKDVEYQFENGQFIKKINIETSPQIEVDKKEN